MGLEVRLPSSGAPRPLGLIGVAVVCLAIGLAVAKWGMEPERRGEESGSAEAGSEADAEAGSESASEAEAESESESGSESEAESESESESESGSGSEAESEAEAGSEAESESEAEAEAGSEAEAAAAEGAPLRFVRGRIAYLRCDGVGRGRAAACPRDERMEEAVWAALAALATCEGGPRAAGEGDLRLAWEGTGAADVLWRDTFADDVVRLDRDAVLGCVAAPLAATRQTIGAERLFVSFRFRME